jgi:hypothetical protein
MDLAELKARALAARQFEVAIGECNFTLRTPTRLELREALLRHGIDVHSALALVLLQRYLLHAFVVGWSGVRVNDILADADSAPLPWSADAVPLLLDAQPEWSDTLGTALMAAVYDRSERIEAEAKN